MKKSLAILVILLTCGIAWAADNFAINIFGGDRRVLRTTDTAGVHTPWVNVANGTTLATDTQLQGNASGTTGAVVGTLAAAVGRTTYICGFNVNAVGGTAPVGPIVVAGLVTASQNYEMNSAAIPVMLSQNFWPCIPASATNTAITITTVANGTATGVRVNSWGFQR